MKLPNPLPKPNQECKEEKQIEESNINQGKHIQDTFRALTGVHFIHTIDLFEAWEVRSPTLQTVHELELKRRSYDHLKTTALSCGKIS